MRHVVGAPSTSNDDYQLNTTTFIRHAARTHGDQEIVYRSSDGVLMRYTYRQAHERMKRLANALESVGVAPGDKVGVLDWNTHRHFEMYFAIPGIGATLVQLNLRISSEDLTHVVNHSETSYLAVSESLLSVAEAIIPNCPGLKGFIVMADGPLVDVNVPSSMSPVHGYEELLAEASSEFDWPMIDERTAYSACFTSGSTGRPKGVFFSHRNIYLHSMAMAMQLSISSDDCHMVIVPMFHGQSWGLFYACAAMGAKLVFPGRYAADDLGDLVELMAQESVTVAHGAPAIFQPMLRYIEAMPTPPDLSRARLISGATEPSLTLMRGFKELTGADIIHIYGATETTPLTTLNYRIKPGLRARLTEEEKWDLKRKQGLPVTGVDVAILDPEGKEMPHDGKSVGEVCMRGPWVAAHYHNAPETADQFRGGYWHSGDAGMIDENGYLKVVDRIKDVIKSGGEWISSIDMENLIVSHPDVDQATVVGLPHPEWQERPFALVVTRSGEPIPEEGIRGLLLTKFARWQLPDEIIFVDELPKTSVGKINKRQIVAAHQDHYSNATDTSSTDAAVRR